MRADPKGKATVEFEPGVLWERQHKSLAKLLKCFLTDPAAA